MIESGLRQIAYACIEGSKEYIRSYGRPQQRQTWHEAHLRVILVKKYTSDSGGRQLVLGVHGMPGATARVAL